MELFSEPQNTNYVHNQNLSSEDYSSSDDDDHQTSPQSISSQPTSSSDFATATTTGELANNSPPPQESISTNLAGNSCEHCKKVHRRCDRVLPSCTRCIKKGVECNYMSPKKRGRPKKPVDPNAEKPTRRRSQHQKQSTPQPTVTPLHISDTPVIIPNLNNVFSAPSEPIQKQRQSITKKMEGDTTPYKTAAMLLAQHEKNITNYKLQVAQLIDVYVDFISSGEVLLDREKAMAILNEKILNKSRGVQGDKKQRTAECLLTAIEAIALHRLGQIDEAKLMFEKAKTLCMDSEIFEQHLDNFEVAAAMAIISLYVSGDPSKQPMCYEFLRNVNAFIENQRNKIKTITELGTAMSQTVDTSLLEDQIAKLEKYVSCIQITLAMNHYNESEFNTPGLVNKLNIAAYCTSKLRFIKPEIRRQILELINATKTTVEMPIDKCENLCVTLLQKKLQMLDLLRDQFTLHLRNVPIVNLIWHTLTEGFHLELILEYQRRIPLHRQDQEYVQSQLLYYANRITKTILEESSWFQFGCTSQQRYVIMAALIHLKYINSSLELLDTEKFAYSYDDINAILKGDLWALEIILKLYPCKSETNSLIVSIVQQLKNCLQTLQLKHTLNVQKQQMEEMNKYLALSKLVASSNLGYPQQQSPMSLSLPPQQIQQLQQLLQQQLHQQQQVQQQQTMERQMEEKLKNQSLLEQQYSQQHQLLNQQQQQLLSQQHVTNFVSPLVDSLEFDATNFNNGLQSSQSEYDAFLKSEDLNDLENHSDLQDILKRTLENSQTVPDTNSYFSNTEQTEESINPLSNFVSDFNNGNINGELSSASTSQKNLLDFFNDLDKMV